MNPRFTTILDALPANVEKHPDKLLYAFLDADGRIAESYTYGTFMQRTVDIASHISGTCDLDPGDRVLLVYPPGLEMVCALFACVRLGLIPVPVCPPSSHGFTAALYQMNHIAEDCEAAAVLTDRSYLWSIKLNRARTSLARFSLTRDHTSVLKWIVTNDAPNGVRADYREASSDILFLQYTSGSTSAPKGVMVTHQNVLQNCDTVFEHVPIGVSWLPQHHDMGLIGAYLFAAIAGGTVYGMSPIDFIQRPSLWLETMSRYRATVTAAPNFAYQYCLRPDKVADEELHRFDLSSLRLVMNGAEPVRPDVFRGFLERFGPCGLPESSFCTAYGLAEYTLAVSNGGTVIRSFDAQRLGRNHARVVEEADPSEWTGTEKSDSADTTALVSCGRPLGTTRIRIVDTTHGTREAPEGRVGEVWVTGPSKCLGYWNKAELSEQIFEARIDGDHQDSPTWLRTGDLGFLHDGELFICGRAKDLIIVRGLNYHPQDIERIVEQDPAIRPGCVAAFAVEKEGGEALAVVAELRSAARRPDTEALNRSLGQRLGIVADAFVYIPARTIPKTSSGKIIRHPARTRWIEQRLKVIEEIEVASLPPVRHGCLETTFRRYGLTGSESLTLGEIGMDSLAVAEFALDLENFLKAQGADDLAAAVDVRWVQRIAISELFELLRQLTTSAAHAKVRFQQALAGLRREHRELEHEMMLRDARLGLDPEARHSVEASPILASPSPNAGAGCVLLTGGTGFFGPFMLRSLLRQCGDEIRVLVRADDPAHAMERIREGMASLGESALPGLAEAWEHRVKPVCGDLSRPHLGVSTADWAALCENVHSIYHNGALVNYLLDYASMRAVNVIGTRDVVRLARTGRPKILNHISTTFVFGWSSKDTLFESDNNQDMALLDFGYSQTKWVSEQIVLNAMRQGLSARVFRPALIAPSVSGGGYNFDIAIRMLVFMIKNGISTTTQNQVSFSPADLVADNIVAISNLPDTVGETLHVTRDTYSTMMEITGILGELTQTEFVDYDIAAFVPLLIERCDRDDLLFPLLNFLVRSVDKITAMEFKRYDNRHYRLARARSPFGREDPSLEDVVVGILRFLRRQALVEGQDTERVLEQA